MLADSQHTWEKTEAVIITKAEVGWNPPAADVRTARQNHCQHVSVLKLSWSGGCRFNKRKRADATESFPPSHFHNLQKCAAGGRVKYCRLSLYCIFTLANVAGNASHVLFFFSTIKENEQWTHTLEMDFFNRLNSNTLGVVERSTELIQFTI